MSVDAASERVCYVHCNFCNTVLAVSVPCSSMLSNIVRVRCGHCSNLLSVNMGSLLHSLHLQDTNFQTLMYMHASPLKRQRVPSAYNRFIKEEIQRIKASNPEMRHREAFSTAAKNWAHFPDINNYGLKLGANKLAKLDHHADAAGGDRSTHRS
ncbi:hypothetical protein MIMGU_mgv1a025679mg [Erythranthe guttata]|uniref:Uncharacterized protein n=1 Tax=Erythranthe guttata TaxID=4155 RepID=A0A022R7P1_ERYGU|nr:hypothetical protein MIMGU_mgv1a025679mg [Erythranthe guttata]